MRRKLNWKNLIKLIIMVCCVLIASSDYLTILINIFKGITVGFTWYGIIINIILLFIVQIIYEDLFEE